MAQAQPSATTIQALPDAVLCRIFSHIGDGRFLPKIGSVCKQWRRVSKMCAHLCLCEQDGCRSGNLMQEVSCFVYSFKCIRSLRLISRLRRNMWTEVLPGDMSYNDKGFPDLHLRGMVWHVRKTIQELGFAYPAYYYRIWIDLAKCPLLQRLQLQNAWIDAFPKDASPFLRLETCHLISVLVISSALTELVSVCPVLKHLKLESCKTFTEMLISSKSLEIIFISSCNIKFLTLQTPNLKLLDLDSLKPCDDTVDGKIFELRARNTCTFYIPASPDRYSSLKKLEIEGIWSLNNLPHFFNVIQDIVWQESWHHTKWIILEDLNIQIERAGANYLFIANRKVRHHINIPGIREDQSLSTLAI